MNTYQRCCERKRKYHTKGEAKAGISRLKRRHPADDFSDYRPYRCPYCFEYHVGHQERLTGLVTLAKRLAA